MAFKGTWPSLVGVLHLKLILKVLPMSSRGSCSQFETRRKTWKGPFFYIPVPPFLMFGQNSTLPPHVPSGFLVTLTSQCFSFIWSTLLQSRLNSMPHTVLNKRVFSLPQDHELIPLLWPAQSCPKDDLIAEGFLFYSRIFDIKCLRPLWINSLLVGDFFVKRIWQNPAFLPFLPITSDSKIDKQQSHSQFRSQDIPKNPSSWLNVSCIIHFSDISWVSPPLPLHSHGEREIVILSALFQSIPEKNTLLCLGALMTLFSGLRTDPLYPSAESVLRNMPSHFPHLLTRHNICVSLLWKTLVIFSPTASSQPSFCHGLWRLRQSHLSLGLAQREKLFAVNTDTASREENEALSPRRRWIQLFDYLGTDSSDRHTALGGLRSCPDGQCCNYPHFPAAVSSLLKAGLDCLRSRIQFAVPPVTCCDSFGDKSGLNWVQVSLLWDRREV